jgi:hypothetical protein
MVALSPTQISLPLLGELRVLCVKTHLQPRPGPGVGVHPDRLGTFTARSLSSFRNLQTFQLSNLSTCPRANSHRITSFAHHYPLTPIESNLCKKQGEGVPTPLFDPLSELNHFFVSNSHRTIFFAYPHPLMSIESYSCKKLGGGVPLTQSCARRASSLCATPSSASNSNIVLCLRHNSRTPRGWRAPHSLFTTRYSLPTP